MPQSAKHSWSLPHWVGVKMVCPECGRMTFKPYVDESGQHFAESFKDADNDIKALAERVGRCDRKNNCNFHYPPSEFFKDTKCGVPEKAKNWTPPPPKEPLPDWPWKDVAASLCTKRKKMAELPTLVEYLLTVAKIPSQIVKTVLEDYWVGTTRSRRIIYWMIDFNGKARDGKMMAYRSDGHRDKAQCVQWTWDEYFKKTIREEHPELKGEEFNRELSKQKSEFDCSKPYFGEHLLADPRYKDKPVALCEAEKTCLIGSMLMPQYLWLGIGTCTPNEYRLNKAIMQRRKIYLFPDLDQLENIEKKVATFTDTLKGLLTVMDDFIRKNAKEAKDDVADILLRAWMSGERKEVAEHGAEEEQETPIVDPWRLAEFSLGIPPYRLEPFRTVLKCELL